MWVEFCETDTGRSNFGYYTKIYVEADDLIDAAKRLYKEFNFDFVAHQREDKGTVVCKATLGDLEKATAHYRTDVGNGVISTEDYCKRSYVLIINKNKPITFPERAVTFEL